MKSSWVKEMNTFHWERLSPDVGENLCKEVEELVTEGAYMPIAHILLSEIQLPLENSLEEFLDEI